MSEINIPVVDVEDESDQEGNSTSISEKSFSKSHIYDHFTVDVFHQNKLKCKHCSQFLEKDKSGSTGNLRKHMRRKHALINIDDVDQDAASSQGIQRFFSPASEFDAAEYENVMLNFVIRSDQPFSVCETKEFVDFAVYKRPKAKTPCARTLKSRLLTRYEKERNELFLKLQEVPGKISLILDGWLSKNVIAFQGIIASWVSKEWKYEEMLLDLDVLQGRHTGKRLMASLIKVLDEYGILEKVNAITTDNASNCESMMKEFSSICLERGLKFDVSDQHVRCLAHIVNLACNDALTIIKKEGQRSNSFGNVSDESDDESSDDASDENFSDFNSEKQSDSYESDCNGTSEKTDKQLKLSIYGRPFESIIRSDKRLSKYSLTEGEWLKVEEIIQLLGRFQKVTVDLSKSKVPTLSLTAAIYIDLYNHLESYTVENDKGEWIITAASAACAKLNKYYPKSDGLVYIMGLILDPRCKLEWYKTVGIDAETIKLNKRTVFNHWNKFYKPSNANANSTDETNTDLVATQMKKARLDKLDELKQYLALPVVNISKDRNILEWWKANESSFPALAAMARDFLAISGTGIPIERLFTIGSDLLKPKYLSMSPQVVRKRFCLKAWLRCKSADYNRTKMKEIARKMRGID